jgi:hypothetical protein
VEKWERSIYKGEIKMKNYKFLKRFLLVFIGLFTINFMSLTTGKLKWNSKFPVVSFKIGSLPVEDNVIKENIKNAAKKWSMLKTNARFSFVYSGKNSKSFPFSSEETYCSEQFVNEMKAAENTIFTVPTVNDPDCTSSACSFIWSCERKNEILHFDTQINISEFDSILGLDGQIELQAKIAHELGHIIGLGHCSIGDNTTECQTKLTNGQTEPSKTDVMYKFPKEIIHPTGSDIGGINFLYGETTDAEKNTFQKMKDYYDEVDNRCLLHDCSVPTLSIEEINAYNRHQSLLASEDLHTSEAVLYKHRQFQELFHSAYSESSYSAEEHLLQTLFDLHNKVTKLSKDSLQGSILIISIQIKDREKAINSYSGMLDTMYYKFLQAELKTLVMIRKEMKDELARR